jgi:ParB family transcriptional regulator, chromosome partitioning protein
MAKKQGLGRGLNALLAGVMDQPVTNTSQQNSTAAVFELPIQSLTPGRYQPRTQIHPTELETLADSIRVQGVLQPIVVRPLEKDRYEIIAGERRFRAAMLAGLEFIPAVVKDVKDEAALAIALIENIQRENLSALEEAMALERLSKEFNLTHIQVAEAVGKSRAAVTNLLRLLTLTDDVKLLLERGDIEAGHAKVLLTLRGHQQSQVARTVVARGLSVRETEKLVAKLQEETSTASFRRRVSDPNIRLLQNSLAEKLGASVEIMHGNQGKGRVVIQYNTLDELDGILAHIQ